jgi:hypothetical protein
VGEAELSEIRPEPLRFAVDALRRTPIVTSRRLVSTYAVDNMRMTRASPHPLYASILWSAVGC